MRFFVRPGLKDGSFIVDGKFATRDQNGKCSGRNKGEFRCYQDGFGFNEQFVVFESWVVGGSEERGSR